MIKSIKSFIYFAVSIALLASFQTEAFAAKKSKTLKKTQKTGFVRCGVSQGLPGFSNAVSNSDYSETNYSYGNYFAYKNADGSHTDSDIDFLWANFTNSKDSMDKANESFEKDVRAEMFPLFSEFASCAEVPDVYHSWTFYNSEAKDFMPDFTTRN